MLYENPSKEAYLIHPEYLTVLGGFKDFAINQRGYDLLKNQSNLVSIDKENLVSKINLFFLKNKKRVLSI